MVTPEIKMLAQQGQLKPEMIQQHIRDKDDTAPPASFKQAEQAIVATKFIIPNDVVELKDADGNITLVQLSRRTVEDSPALAASIQNEQDNMDYAARQLIIRDWFAQCVKTYEVYVNTQMLQRYSD